MSNSTNSTTVGTPSCSPSQWTSAELEDHDASLENVAASPCQQLCVTFPNKTQTTIRFNGMGSHNRSESMGHTCSMSYYTRKIRQQRDWLWKAIHIQSSPYRKRSKKIIILQCTGRKCKCCRRLPGGWHRTRGTEHEETEQDDTKVEEEIVEEEEEKIVEEEETSDEYEEATDDDEDGNEDE